MNLGRIKDLDAEVGPELINLLRESDSGDIKSLKRVRELVCSCEGSVRDFILDAVPKNPLIRFAVMVDDYDRMQIAASLLWLFSKYPDEVNEFLDWLELPSVEGQDELRGIMQSWIVEED